MRLPSSLIRLRSTIAQLFGLGLRLLDPLILRLGRFVYEVRARSRLRGHVAPGVQFVGPIGVEGEGCVDLGAGTRIGRRCFFETYGGARIVIGSNVTINDGVTLVAYSGLRIGDYAMVGEYSSIRDAKHGTRRGVPVRLQDHESEMVTVGQDAWIGRGVIISKGVDVGEGAVVGANSVVTHDVPPNEIVAGAPARRIGERSGVSC